MKDTPQEQLSLFEEGRILRDKGMNQVSSHAGEWKDIADTAIRHWYNQLPPGTTFMGEDIRTAVLPLTGHPHHPNAWGAVIGYCIREWLKSSAIQLAGIKRAKDPRSHAHFFRVYRKI